MKILFILEHFHPAVGGVETLFATLGAELVKQGHSVTVLATDTGGLPNYEEWKGIHIHRVNSGNRYFFTFFSLHKAYNLAADCDLIQTTSYNAAPAAWIAGKLRGKPVVITFHEAWGKLWFKLPFITPLFQWSHYLYEQLLLKMPFTKVISVSDATSDSLLREGVSAKRIKRIYNGLQYADFNPSGQRPNEDSRFSVVYLGRMGISKGIDLLMEAQKELQQESDIHFTYITSDTQSVVYKALQKFIHKYELSSQTTYIENADFEQLKTALQRADAIAIPSYSEGFCFVAVEAAALGVLIIHSGQAALAETVSGKHIKMKSHTAEALAEAVLTARGGAWQHKPTRRFELSDTVENYIQLYRKLLNMPL